LIATNLFFTNIINSHLLWLPQFFLWPKFQLPICSVTKVSIATYMFQLLAFSIIAQWPTTKLWWWTTRGLRVFIMCFFVGQIYLFSPKVRRCFFGWEFFFLKWNSINFPTFLLHCDFSETIDTKKMKILGTWNDGMHVIYLYAFVMCKIKNHNINKKSNITQISNTITHYIMIPW